MSKNTHTLKLLTYCILIIAIVGCKKEVLNDTTTIPGQDYAGLSVNNSQIGDRISRANKIVIWQSDGLKKDPFTGGQIEDRGGEANPDDDIYWLHIGDVNPLEYGGQTLSATHVVVKDGFAYVSYHSRGAGHLGAIESVDLSDAEHPVVVSQAFFNQADVNAIEIDQEAPAATTRLWAALSDSKKGAVLLQLDVVNGRFSDQLTYVNLSNGLPSGGISSSANSIEHAGHYLYVTSGKSYGGIYVLNADNLEIIGVQPFSDAKYVVANGSEAGVSKVVTLQAGKASSLKVEVVGKYAFEQTTDIGNIIHQNTDANESGKSTLYFQKNIENIVYATMGAAGFKSFDISSGFAKETWSSPSDMIKKGNCNNITSDGNFIYVANGADGLAVFQIVDGEAPRQVFGWDLDEQGASVNYVETDGDFVFVAKGQGGLKILKRPQPGDLLPMTTFNNQGTPLQMAPLLELCGTLLTTIFDLAVPEYFDQQVAHPEYFLPEVEHRIILEEASEVSITFLNEGAGYTNSLGYYYYDAANPPASLDDVTKIIIFPNASAVGSGGELVPGSTMKLLGSFNENTVIGFFLIANGWQGGDVTNGYGTIYTEPEYNPAGQVQSLIFHDQECNSTVVCFEDILLPSGDKDYNDAIFQITTSPASAIKVDRYLQLH